MAVLLWLLIFSGICIMNAHKFEYDPRIINGEPVSANKYPWMVSFRARFLSTGEDFAFCGGTLIELDPPIILSAAHCFPQFLDYNETDDTPIYLWGYESELYANINRTYKYLNLPNDTYYSLRIYPSNIHVHPSWANPSHFFSTDLVLIILDDYNISGSDLDNYDGDIPSLSSTNKYFNDDNPNPQCCPHGEMLQVIGYGRKSSQGTSEESESHVLRATSAQYLTIDECTSNHVQAYFDRLGIGRSDRTQNLTEILAPYIPIYPTLAGVDTVAKLEQWMIDDYLAARDQNIRDNSVICIANDVDDGTHCNGDSGGPVFRYDDDGNPELVGVVSFDLGGCTSGYFNGDVNVATHYDWIQDTIIDVLGITDEPTMYPTLEPTFEPTIEPTIVSSAFRISLVMSVLILQSIFNVCL